MSGGGADRATVMVHKMTVLTFKLGWPRNPDRMWSGRILQGASAIALMTACACAPLNPSMSELAGEWRVDWQCGSEILNLREDGNYTYTIGFPGGERVTDTGRWTIRAKREFLEGAQIQLQNALEPCSASGENLGRSHRGDRQLETIWEWGRTILSFNPDLEGFTRKGD
jgi:hypothetical protein